MQLNMAGELAGEIIARFRMLGMFTDDAMRRAYFNVLIAYDDEEAPRRTRKMLADNNQPCTDRELDILLSKQDDIPLNFDAPRTDPARGRAIMRKAWIDGWCQRHGGTEADFWEHEEKMAQAEHRPTLKEQWRHTDKAIAARKAAGLPVDESGLLDGALSAAQAALKEEG